jgi:O-antigen/teichoic acid export membrane protein
MNFPGKQQMSILLDQAVFSGTSFLITIGVARKLSMEEFGWYSGNILGLYLAVSILSSFVIQPFQVMLGKVENRAAYVSVNFWFQVLGAAILLAVGLVAAVALKWSVPGSAWLFAAGFLFHDFGRRLLLALNKPISSLLLDVMASMSLLTALGCFYLSAFADLPALLTLFSIAYIVPFLFLLMMVKPWKIHRSTFRTAVQWHFESGKWLFLTAITQWWSGNLLVVASGLYLGSAALGALRLAQSLMGVLNILLQTFENYILPQTAGIIHKDMEQGVNYLAGVSRKAAFFFLPVVVICFLFAGKIMVLAGGPSYESYAYVMQGISILYILVFISQPIRLLVRSMMLHQHFFYGYIFSLVLTILFSNTLLSNFGLTGAIIGLAGSQIALISYWILILQKRNIQLWKSFTSF